MSVNNAAVIVPAEGHFYLAPVGSAKPTTTGVPAAPWVEVGHTSFEDPLVVERDGGDITVLRSWQATAVRSSIEGITYKLTFGLLEHDDLAWNLYYGGGAVNATTDEFEVPKTPAAQQKALFVRLVDGAAEWSRYFSLTEVIGSDDEEFDPEELLSLPVTAVVMDDPAVSYLFAIKGSTSVLP